ncbi:AMP-binding protein [Nocardia harenae]|uniref:AMP-binding protein n=1 Tax=Nocardia harenae TaxID=358707 RepID=UPI00082F6BDD|nr:AMP-binding protein [Nocardia harenae]
MPSSADKNAVVVSGPDTDLTAEELHRWSNRLARMLLGMGAEAGAPIAVAIDSPVEAAVAERAITKVRGIPLPVENGVLPEGAKLGITHRARRTRLTDEVRWLILDEPATLRRYLVGSDSTITVADRSA